MAKKLAMVFGVVFLLVGILGFIPNPFFAEDGFFHTDIAHNLVHLVSGLVFVLVAIKSPHKAPAVLKVFGITYLLVAVLGFLAIGPNTEHANLLGIVGVNAADNWLHLILGLLILGGGLARVEKSRDRIETPMSQPMA